MTFALRKVTEADVDLLFQWANEREVRQNAFSTELIPYETHVAWFAKMLANENVENYIMYAVEDVSPVGQIRFAIEDGTALISYTVDAPWRGKGMGSQMLLMAEEKLRTDRSDVQCCKAQVKFENPASARVFEKCGYRREEKKDYLEFTKDIIG